MKEKIKIVQLFKIYWPDNGGGIAKVIENISECVKKWNEEEKKIKQEIIVCQSDNSKVFVCDSYNDVKVYRCRQLKDIASTPISFQFLNIVKRHTKNADIVIYHFPYPMVDLAVLFHLIHGKLVIWWHCDYDTSKHKIMGKLYGPLVRHTLKRADRIIVSAQGNIDGCKDLVPYKSKCEIIPFAVSDEWAQLGREYFYNHTTEKQEKTNILFLGRFVWYKGIDYLLRAYSMLEQNDYTLTLLGDGPLLNEMKELAKKLKIVNITFAGSVSDEEKMENIKNCDFMVLPSISKAEAFAIVQIEAMAFGKPVINTSLPSGVPEVCPDSVAGITVEPKDVKALYKAMKKLGEDDELRNEYGKNAFQIVQEKNTMKIMKEYHRRMFENLIR